MNDARGAVWRRGREFSEILFGLQETNERRFRDAVGGLHGHYERAIYARSVRVIFMIPTSVNYRRTFAFGDRPRATRPAAPTRFSRDSPPARGIAASRFAGPRSRQQHPPAASASASSPSAAPRSRARTSAASSFAMNFSLSPRSRGSDYSALASDGNEALLTRNEQARRTRSRRARASSPERRDRTLLEIRARRANDEPVPDARLTTRPRAQPPPPTPRVTPTPPTPRDPGRRAGRRPPRPRRRRGVRLLILRGCAPEPRGRPRRGAVSLPLSRTPSTLRGCACSDEYPPPPPSPQPRRVPGAPRPCTRARRSA